MCLAVMVGSEEGIEKDKEKNERQSGRMLSCVERKIEEEKSLTNKNNLTPL